MHKEKDRFHACILMHIISTFLRDSLENISHNSEWQPSAI